MGSEDVRQMEYLAMGVLDILGGHISDGMLCRWAEMGRFMLLGPATFVRLVRCVR